MKKHEWQAKMTKKPNIALKPVCVVYLSLCVAFSATCIFYLFQEVCICLLELLDFADFQAQMSRGPKRGRKEANCPQYLTLVRVTKYIKPRENRKKKNETETETETEKVRVCAFAYVS